MGLDMYFKGKRYLSKYNGQEDTKLAEAIQQRFPELQGIESRWGDSTCIEQITADLGYWRKANAIHGWFVKNIQDGNDDCGSYYVSRESMQELRDLCQRVLDFKHLAEELLPPQSGFFFGGTSLDQSYYDDLQATVEIIDQALKLPDSWEFEYHASW